MDTIVTIWTVFAVVFTEAVSLSCFRRRTCR